MGTPAQALGFWKFVLLQRQRGIHVMLLQVLESMGSSPGRQGFRMAITESNELFGSVGGGIMEHKLVEMARSRLLEQLSATSVHRQVHDKAAPRHQSGMICSGEQTVLVYRIQDADFEAIQEISDALQKNESVTLRLTPQGMYSDKSSEPIIAEWKIQSEQEWVYRETLGFRHHLHIIGGGHCSLALSRIAAMLDFCIHLYEDRPDLNTFRANDFAHYKTVVDDYTSIAQCIPEGPNQFVVSMTFGYRTDDLVVRSLYGKAFDFIGVLGSKSKIEKMWQQYRSEGLSEEWLGQVSAPVGLPIKSETPEEIAVSIAAEIIRVKNREKATMPTESKRCC